MNDVLNVKLVTPSGDDVKLTSKFVPVSKKQEKCFLKRLMFIVETIQQNVVQASVVQKLYKSLDQHSLCAFRSLPREP